MSTRHIVLVGAGHAHHHLLSQASRMLRPDQRLSVIAPPIFWYSGMAAGMLSGVYRPEDCQLDVAAMTRSQGATFVPGTVVGIDRLRRQLTLHDGNVITYDLLSLGVGSVADLPLPMAPGCQVVRVKPLTGLLTLREQVLRRAAASGEVAVIIVGAGPSGCEIAAQLPGLIRTGGGLPRVTLLAWPALLPGQPAHVVAAVIARLGVLGVEIRVQETTAITHEGVELASGGLVPGALVVMAAGLRPPPLASDAGLAVDTYGALLVDEHLRSLTDETVFGGGDCVSLRGHHLPRLGVFGVREGPLLAANLVAAAAGLPLRPYRPQARWLSILNLGPGHASASWGPWTCTGRTAWWLKNHIDRRFIAKYRRRMYAPSRRL